MSNRTQSDYPNIVVAGLFPTRNGNYYSGVVNDKTLETIAKAVEVGGKFCIRLRTKEAIAKAEDPSRTPVAYIEFIPKEEVDRNNAEYKASQARGL